MMDETERLLVQRGIAAILDHPSVYMSGPSKRSMRLAASIIEDLEKSKRLVSTSCDHSAWDASGKQGAYCPVCYTLLC